MTNSQALAEKMKMFRNHGISTDYRQRETQGSWFYEMRDLGFNYRITDFQCALGLSQLGKLRGWIVRRQEIAQFYNTTFVEMPAIRPLEARDDVSHAYHLYVVQLNLSKLRTDRPAIFRKLRAVGIGVNVHYVPVHLQAFYRGRFHTEPGICPIAEAAYERILSLPIFPALNDKDVNAVITAVRKSIEGYPS